MENLEQKVVGGHTTNYIHKNAEDGPCFRIYIW